ncbi:MAG TPA: DUF4038 domain-containing protein [Candidatus Limnocylindria bacterium]|jgi:hypothetical protein|nr:DUF4038 domain-containing protein [Candidatus Limnocylindria bacterium]
MRLVRLLCLLAFLSGPVHAAESKPAKGSFPLRISASHRFLEDHAGRPFLYVADTPWHLLTRLTPAEMDRYLSTRATQGFSAIQIELVPEGADGSITNRSAEPIFFKPYDLATLNGRYLDSVAAALRRAEEFGLLVAMNPVWLGCCDGGWRDVLKTNGVAKCRAYGELIGRRFATNSNLLWIDGGDRDPGPWMEYVRAIANGVKAGAPGQLHTAHASSTHSSLDVYPHEPWLDLNATYTYSTDHSGAWTRQFHVYHCARLDYLREPAVPFFLIESTYELEHEATSQKVRRQAWWSVLSGAFGTAMGNGQIWPLRAGWEHELKSPAARDHGVLARFLAGRPWWQLTPDFDHQVLTGGLGTANETSEPGGDDYATVMFGANRGLLLAYLPTPRKVTVDLAKFRAPVHVRWLDPTSGKITDAPGSPVANLGPDYFAPPERNMTGDGDWVLVVEATK